MTAPTLGPFDGVTILGAARALPGEPLTTRDALSATPSGARMSDDRLDWVASQLDASLGLRTRHWSYTPGDPTPHGSDTRTLAREALSGALASAGAAPESLGALMVATSTPHRFTSTVAGAVGGELGVRAPCVDVRSGCSGGVFGLTQTAIYVRGGAGHVALVGADTFSAVLPPEHRLSACVMGDGAAALVLGPGPGTLHAVHYDTDGSLGHLVGTCGAMPPRQGDLDAGGYLLSGDPEGLAAEVPGRYVRAITRVLEHAGRSIDEVDLFLPHQTSASGLIEVGALVGLPAERVWTRGVAEHANIGAAGWMSAIAGALDAGAVGPGSLVLTAAVGGGVSWGAALWTL